MTVDEDEDSADDEDTVLLKQKIKAVRHSQIRLEVLAFAQCEGLRPIKA